MIIMKNETIVVYQTTKTDEFFDTKEYTYRVAPEHTQRVIDILNELYSDEKIERSSYFNGDLGNSVLSWSLPDTDKYQSLDDLGILKVIDWSGEYLNFNVHGFKAAIEGTNIDLKIHKFKEKKSKLNA